MELWTWIAIGAVAVVVLSALVVSGTRIARRTGRRRRHQDELKTRFGPEYELAVARQGRKGAEQVLEERLSAYEDIQHPSIGPSERETHTLDWRQAQYRFVDSPERAIREAEHIVVTVMEQRGYPAEDASSRADALSVDDPGLANSYRVAHQAFLMADRGAASVDQLLDAFFLYRELLEFLLDRPQREDTVFDAEPPQVDRDPWATDGQPQAVR